MIFILVLIRTWHLPTVGAETIELSDGEMEAISKYKIQNYLKKRVREVTLEYVEGLKQKHSKTQKYDTSRLSTSPYLNDSSFTKTERELLFKLRTRTI